MIRLAGLMLAAGLTAFAQHAGEAHAGDAHAKTADHAAAAEHKEGGGDHGGGHGAGLDGWKWANFALLAGLLGWVIKKNAGPFFAGRDAEIRKGIADADKLRVEAEARTAEVNARLANLQVEIDGLKKVAVGEQQAEAQRLRAQTAAEIAKIQANAQEEIASAGKAARQELKKHAAQLAVGLAEEKIRREIDPRTQEALVAGFAQTLTQPPGRAASN